MMEIAKSMGLTLIKLGRGKVNKDGPQDANREAALVLPLVKYKAFSERRKRKKML